MTRLLRAEASRLLSRRFTVVMLLGVLLLLAAFQLAVNSMLSPPSATDVAASREAFAASHLQWQQDLQQCQAGGAADCADNFPEPRFEDYSSPPPSFPEATTASLQVTTYLVALAVFLVGASFVGAEYSSGSIANWLTFVPRRGLVFTSKLAILAVFAGVVAAVALALTLATATVLASVHGVTVRGLPALLAAAGRGILPAVLLSALGFCLGLVARHTAAAIGVLLGYLFVWFVRGSVLADVGWAARLTRWSPEGNLAAIVERGHRYQVPTRTLTPQGVSYDYVEAVVSLGHGLAYAAVLLAVGVLGAWLVFRRRDLA